MPLQHWPVEKLLARWDRLNLTPKYQRGAVWDDRRKILLVDSLLAGLDVPKIYLHPVRNNVIFDFEVVDGQQRLRAIKEFVDGKFAVPANNGVSIEANGEQHFGDLSSARKRRFCRYRLTVSIADVSPAAARMLFSRLQLGSSLNQAELRNAMPSVACHEVDMFVLTHPLFASSKIAEGRFKRHDYLTHALAYSCFRGGTPAIKDVKAATLRHFITAFEKGIGPAFLKSCAKVLDIMHKVNQRAPGIFRNKWTFFDAYIWFEDNLGEVGKADAGKLAKAIKRIESERRNHTRNTEVLLESSPGPQSDARLLFNYINAYKASGALVDSIDARKKFMVHRLGPILHD